MATLSELFLAILLLFGLAAPGTSAGTHDPGSLGVAVAADERGGNFDPDGFTSPPDDGERRGNFDPDGAV